MGGAYTPSSTVHGTYDGGTDLVAIGEVRLLSTSKVANGAEELNFYALIPTN